MPQHRCDKGQGFRLQSRHSPDLLEDAIIPKVSPHPLPFRPCPPFQSTPDDEPGVMLEIELVRIDIPKESGQERQGRHASGDVSLILAANCGQRNRSCCLPLSYGASGLAVSTQPAPRWPVPGLFPSPISARILSARKRRRCTTSGCWPETS